MKNLVVFSGQGNTSIKDLKNLIKTKQGQELMKELNKSEQFSTYVKKAINNDLGTISYDIISTFISNEVTWRKISERYNVTYFTSYSAGIFNILSATKLVPIENIMQFILQRIKLFESNNFKQKLYFVLSKSSEDINNLMSIIKNWSNAEWSIKISEQSGIIAIDKDEFFQLKDILKKESFKIILKDSGLSVPYHTSFLEPLKSEYINIVESLFSHYKIEESKNYTFILEEDNIKKEILRQLDNNINWGTIVDRIIQGDFDNIFDTSPNNNLKKTLYKYYSYKNVQGSDGIWK